MINDEVLKTEYSSKFDEIRQKMMITSFYKYGPAKRNYPSRIKAIESLEKRLEAYKATGNTEYLADIANFAMLEYMYPSHEKAHYKATDSKDSPGIVGLGISEKVD